MLVPQSPRTNRPSHVAYCAASGRSRPSARRCAVDLLRGGRGADQQARGIARREAQQEEHQRHHAEDHGRAAERPAEQQEKHRGNFLPPHRARQCDTFRRVSPPPSGASRRGVACRPASRRRTAAAPPCSSPPAPTCRASTRCSRCIRSPGRCSATCCSPPSRATTARSSPEPYLAREWSWSAGSPHAHASCSTPACAGTTARRPRRATWPGRSTPRAIRRPAIPGSPTSHRSRRSLAPDDSTVVLRFASPQHRFPDVLTDLAILPAHLLDTVPPARLRQAAWNDAPVGNGPFRFVAHEPNRRWVFAANRDFPAALGGPPRLERLIVVVVDEPTTKLAALTSGELDFAGIQPAHAAFVAPRSRARGAAPIRCCSPTASCSTPGAPRSTSSTCAARSSAAIDRREIVDGYLYGFGTPASGPVPPDVPGYLPVPAAAGLDVARGRRAGDRGSSCSRWGAARRRWSRWCRRGSRAAGFDVRHPAARALRLPGPGVRAGATISTPPCSASRATSGSAICGPLAELAGSRGAGGSRGGPALLRGFGAGGVSLSCAGLQG